MEENQSPQEGSTDESNKIPRGQIWFDKILLLLAVSILITGLIYNAWGLWELFH